MYELKHARTDKQITRCFPTMAELRPHLKPKAFVDLIRHLETQGYELAYIDDNDEVVAVAGYCISTSLFMGLNLYVADLVTSERVRSKGYGKAMMDQLRDIARARGCEHIHLDSGTQRAQAHRFYFREGMTVTSFHFDEKLV